MSKQEKKNNKSHFKIILFVFFSLIIIKLFIFNENSQSFISYNFYNSNNIKRSIITDRSGEIIVSNNPAYSLYISPSHTPEDSSWIKSVATILLLDEKELANKLSHLKIITLISEDLTLQQVERIKKLQINGVEIVKREKRSYSHENLASNIIGFLDKENRGIDGIEYYYENKLRNQTFEGSENTPVFQITMEKNLQRMSELELERLLSSAHATGSVVFMGVDTGEILAMANFPRVSQELFTKENKKIDNFSISQNFRPIPVMLLSSWITFSKNNPDYAHGENVFKENNLSGVFENIKIISPFNDALLKAMTDEGNFHSHFVSLGFGQKTGIDLPDEQSGLIREANNAIQRNWFDFYGTPLQILRAYSALINDGIFVKPLLYMEGLNNNEIQEIANDRLNLKKESQNLRKILAANKGKPIISYDSCQNTSGEATKQVLAIGHYPLDKPQISYIVAINGVEFNPDEIHNHFKRFVEMAQNASKIKLRFAKDIASDNLSLKKENNNNITTLKNMPDMAGMSMRKAIQTLHGACDLSVEGSGVVFFQSPLPGAAINPQKTCQIKLK
jgi:cell division protein FtsI (penicillin-binding protein 3)